MFSSPSRGSYISTVNGVAYTLNATEAILVPFPGFLYLYISFDDLQMAFSEFSSPSRGSYISTSVKSFVNEQDSSSRPLPGVLISLPICDVPTQDAISSRPLPGVLISLRLVISKYDLDGYEVLVPFPGFLYLYLFQV